MTDMKCPVCNKTLHCGATLKSDEYLVDLYQCANPECGSTEFLVGCKEFWDILGQHIRTRKALDISVDALKIARDCCCDYSIECLAYATLNKITALEQKE